MGKLSPTTRLAPSPTGALHLGNARTFLVNWAMARRRGWRVVLRIEDLDGPRVKMGAVESIVGTLSWLGMDWDEGPLVQSAEMGPQVEAMRLLAGKGLAYPSELSRGEIEAAASAPQEGSGEIRFASSLRPAGWDTPREFVDTGTNWRFATPARVVKIEDEFAGVRMINPAETIGDFVVWTKRGTPAYQLAVVVDDARQGVTHVVRGNDLLDSAARQVLLYETLELSKAIPAYCHLPLVLGTDGKRLAKRHGDSRVETYRAVGVPAEAVIGLVGRWCGVGSEGAMSAIEFRDRFDLAKMPRGPITFTPQDDQWLRSKAR